MKDEDRGPEEEAQSKRMRRLQEEAEQACQMAEELVKRKLSERGR